MDECIDQVRHMLLVMRRQGSRVKELKLGAGLLRKLAQETYPMRDQRRHGRMKLLEFVEHIQAEARAGTLTLYGVAVRMEVTDES